MSSDGDMLPPVLASTSTACNHTHYTLDCRDVNSQKSHSRVSTESLDFARVRTFYRRDLSWIAGVGGVEGAIAGRSLTPFTADAGTPSRDK